MDWLKLFTTQSQLLMTLGKKALKTLWEKEKMLAFYHTIPTLMTLGKKTFENIVGKGENAGNQHFLLFPHCFLFFPKQISNI